MLPAKHGASVQQNGAGAAGGAVAGDLGAGQAQLFSDHVRQRAPRLELQLVARSVDPKRDPPQRPPLAGRRTAWPRAFSVRSRDREQPCALPTPVRKPRRLTLTGGLRRFRSLGTWLAPAAPGSPGCGGGRDRSPGLSLALAPGQRGVLPPLERPPFPNHKSQITSPSRDSSRRDQSHSRRRRSRSSGAGPAEIG